MFFYVKLSLDIYKNVKRVYNSTVKGDEMIQFGVAANPDNFYQRGNRYSEQMPKYLFEMGLEAYEYQCSRGIRVSDKKAQLMKEEAMKYGIALSIHAPYYISLSTQEEQKKQKTIQYIIDTMKVAKKMGAKEIVVHAGSTLGLERKFAVESACILLQRTMKIADQMGLSDVIVCPETMGKYNQLGNSKEIIKMCLVDKRLKPTIDFGHLYCREYGKLVTYQDWKNELQMYIDQLGFTRMKHFHAHFSKMEYTIPGGEKRHVTFADEEYGPDFIEVAKALIDLNLEPMIFSESAGTQDIDSLKMKQIYLAILENKLEGKERE